MKRKDIKSMTSIEVREFIMSAVRSGMKEGDFYLMHYEQVYLSLLKNHMPTEYFYRLAYEIFDYKTRSNEMYMS